MSTEYQALVTSGQNNYDAQISKKSTKSLKKLGYMVVFALLVVGALAVYALSPKNIPHGARGLVHNNLRRYQMETGHPGIVPKRWSETKPCVDDRMFTMTLAVKEENMDKLDDWVMEVSDPKSPKRGQYWTAEKIQETFAPSEETLQKVMAWLEPHGFTTEAGTLRYRSLKGNLLQMDVTCEKANEMLQTTYMVYEEQSTGATTLRVQDSYSVPDEVAELIDWIEPTLRFPIKSHTKKMEKLDITKEELESDGVKFEGYNTPPRLYTLYGMDDAVLNDDLLTLVEDSGMSQGIVSYDEEYYEDSDLELAWSYTGYAYTNSLDQMTRVPENQSEGYGSEAELDTQYITATGLGLDTYVYYINGDNDDYFSALVEDALEMDDPPSVVSISYGADEYEWGLEYCTRANDGFGKLALLGTTVFASSGDDGALGDDSDCHDNHYTASFPASATYVTAVGGTLGGSWESLQENGTTQEIAWADSGGAFSIYFEISDWQKDAVFNYFDQDITYPDSDHYMLGMRGVPDLSAQAVEYIIAYEGAFYTVSGTSCSSPTVAGMFAMINVKREALELPKLGFLNPTLYGMYDSQGDDYNMFFNDVTAGYNEGCSDDDSIAFYAAWGWDPVTGCGTPKFNEMLHYMINEINRS